MDPAVVSSASFGQLWASTGAGGNNEQFYAHLLTYTPSGSAQTVIACSEMNYCYSLDAKTGAKLYTQNYGAYFSASDLNGCNDISPNIGITGTPIIDPATNTMYFWSKTYNGKGTGVANGIYNFFAVDATTLVPRAGFPTQVEGKCAINSPSHCFEGGKHLQRPGLQLINSVVYAGFGGHCDQFNYTGWVIGMSASTGSPVTLFATQIGTTSSNIGGGVWQSGFGLSSDSNSRMFIVSGNGNSGEFFGTNAPSVTGRQPLQAYEESIVNLQINSDGSLTPQDFFIPFDKQTLDQADKDLGSSGLALLPPSGFPNSVAKKIGLTSGKAGKLYVVNADNLGGFKTSPGGGDNVLQTITLANAVYSGAASYPLEGGYFYITPIGSPTQAYLFGTDSSGNPQFSLAGTTPDTAAGRPGVGTPIVTSMNGQPGTGIVWMTDVAGGTLRAYNAVPNSGGNLTSVFYASPPGITKYHRPTFGDTRLYIGSIYGNILCYGSPVNLPLNCTGNNFGQVNTGLNKTITISCTALTGTKVAALTIPAGQFSLSNKNVVPSRVLKAGDVYTFDATFAPVSANQSAASVNIYTNNTIAGFTSIIPLSLRGQGISQAPLLQVSPVVLTFGSVVVGGDASQASQVLIAQLSNAGETPLLLKGFYLYDADDVSDDDDGDDADGFDPTVTDDFDATKGSTDNFFTINSIPQPGTVLAPHTSVSVEVLFAPNATGNYNAILNVKSNGTAGGQITLYMTGSAAAPSKALLSTQNIDGSYKNSTDILNFGPIYAGTSQSLKMIMYNIGASVLKLTKSKPPVGSVLGASNPEGDLPEGGQIVANGQESASIFFAPPIIAPGVVNTLPVSYSAAWTLNTDDITFGLHVVNITGSSYTSQVGPLLNDGSGLAAFKYMGCYLDSSAKRVLPNIPPNAYNYKAASNSNGYCQTACRAYGYAYAGTEYKSECYCGNVLNASPVTDSYCSYACAGAANQTCGGNGGYISIYADSTIVNTTASASTTTAAGASTTSTPSTGGTTASKSSSTASSTPPATAWQYQSCYNDSVATRALSTNAGLDPGSMTVELCQAACLNMGFTIAGLEYAQECWCDNTLMNGALPGSTNCNAPCNGNAAEICGGSNGLSVYFYKKTSPSSSSAASSSASPSSSVSASASTAATASSQNTLTSSNTRPSTTSAGTTSASASSAKSSPSPSSGWQSLGCYSDSVNTRTLSGTPVFRSNSMTVEMCQSYCLTNGFYYSGVEYGNECYCDTAIGSSGTSGSTACTMSCAGSSSEICGGPNGLSISQYVASSSASPAILGYQYVGCFNDSVATRALGNIYYQDTKNMTVENCISTCSAAGFSYAGLEYSQECYCANSLQNNPVVSTGCSYACTGNAQEYCGGSSRLSLYSFVPPSSPSNSVSASSSGASSTASGSSTVSSSATSSTAGSATTSTPATSTAATSSPSTSTSASAATTSPSVTAGTSQSSTPTATPTPSSTPSSSPPSSSPSSSSPSSSSPSSSTPSKSSTLSTSTTQSTSASASPSSSAPSTSTPATSSTKTTVSTSPSSTQTPTTSTVASSTSNTSATAKSTSSTIATSTRSSTTAASSTPSSNPWQYLACYNDTVSARALPLKNTASASTMTIEACQSYCMSKNYPLAGLEYGGECYCGTQLNNNSTMIAASSCNTKCGGDSTEICGGKSAISLYNYTAYVPPQTVPVVGNYVSMGCYTDLVNNVRSLPVSGGSIANQTVEACVSTCQKKGYPYAGLEYGTECWCGAKLASSASSSSACTSLCGGSSAEFCGGRNALNVYHDSTSST